MLHTMKHLAFDFGIGKSTVSDTIKLAENVLIKSGDFRLPGKKALLSKENEGRTLVVDVTESPIARPKKAERVVFRKKKRHALSRFKVYCPCIKTAAFHTRGAKIIRCRRSWSHLTTHWRKNELSLRISMGWILFVDFSIRNYGCSYLSNLIFGKVL